ncbi:MAG: ferric reductase-like transmembrane domain-containing protein [Euryarchaeota archaeon]|nr:ferric reductase-like transmembrane domain-containing protein [Euryarchaeota archaeon]
MFSLKNRLLVGLGLLLTVTVLTTTGLAQSGGDPRNTSDDFYDAIDGALCMAHHEQEGFRPMLISLVQRYPQMAIGETQNLQVSIRNPWKHTVHDIAVTVNTSAAPNVMVLTGDLPPALENDNLQHTLVQGEHTADKPLSQNLEVLENATTVRVYAKVVEARLADASGDRLQSPKIGLSVKGPSEAADPVKATGSDRAKSVKVQGDDIAKHGFGNWRVNVWYDSGIDDEITIQMGMFVYYNATASTEFTFFAGSDVVLRQDESVTIEIPLQITSADEATLDFAVQTRTHWIHQPGSNAVNNGQFFRFMKMNTKGGDQFISVADTSAPQIVGAQVDLMNLFTRIIGFAAAFIIPIAMVTGGMFGKGSRRVMNKWIGGARKRVLWHSSMSWMIIVIASLHFVFALIETRFTWERGLFWGGVGWALLMSLGVTGYWQVQMIKRWNYRTWRHVHLWSAVGVFVFAGMHTLVEGSDLQVVRDAMPFLERLIWPRI